jgi:SAM-dependent methyltransferase
MVRCQPAIDTPPKLPGRAAERTHVRVITSRHMEGSNEMSELWNGAGGNAWVDLAPVLDQMFLGLETMLADAAAARGAEQVLDVGCGTGATTLAIARRLGAGAACTGVDISAPMVGAATARPAEGFPAPEFIVADAAAYPFEPGAYDLLTSRFGVMFFDDPVAAFANLRRATAPGGGLRFFCWRAPEDNPFMTAGTRATRHLLPDTPERRPGAPGQFAFADEARVPEILAAAGWKGIEVEPVDVPCVFPESGLLPYLTRLGPVGQALTDADEGTRAEVVRFLSAAYAPYIQFDEVHYTAACWSVGAESP